jgi:hypothetical protein
MIVAFYQNRVLGYQILPKYQTVNKDIYVQFLERVILPYIQRHRIRHPIILHDNARPHKHQNVKDFLTRHRWEEFKHPLYSPDLNPCDYNGIARINRPNKGKWFSNELALGVAHDEIICEINLQNIAIGISRLPKRWKVVIKLEGDEII